MLSWGELFTTPGGECFVNSLANLLLVKYEDRKTGMRVIEESNEHPLILRENLGRGGKSIYAPNSPEVILDLTGGRYIGRLFLDNPDLTGRDFLDDVHDLRSAIPEYVADMMVESAMEALDLGLISSDTIWDKVDEYPYILLGSDGYTSQRFGEHAVVRAGECLYVDDGQVAGRIGGFFHRMNGIVEVERI